MTDEEAIVAAILLGAEFNRVATRNGWHYYVFATTSPISVHMPARSKGAAARDYLRFRGVSL